MKQLVLTKCEVEIMEVPLPIVSPNTLLIKTIHSAVSVGTERTAIDIGRSSYIEKAKKHPDKVKQVINKIKTDGIINTFDVVQNKLSQASSLGYCNGGKVVDRGINVKDFKKGDIVVSNGPHAEYINISKNLCAKIPKNVSYETASFTVLGSIGLQGIRLANPLLGECFAVIGVGSIGLLTIQLLLANGCRVICFDFDDEKLKIAQQYGAEVINPNNGNDVVSSGIEFSNGKGVDGVIITASTTSNDPIHQAAQMCRKRGRIILVGVIGLNMLRSDFYEKELSFQVSCSYGPGRYDPEYEVNGNDYPFGFVRWTEQRNFEAILDLMSSNKINISNLISHRLSFKKAKLAYDSVLNDKSTVGILFNYDDKINYEKENKISTGHSSVVKKNPTNCSLGFIGVGNFAKNILLPVLSKSNVNLKTLCTTNPIGSKTNGNKFNFDYCCTDYKEIMDDPEINTVFIATRHNLHSKLVIESIKKGKNVFVEKPLALFQEEMEKIKSLNLHKLPISLMVGFNRRFAPHIVKLKSLLTNKNAPKSFIFTINAGFIPKEHWVHDTKVGGGRIVGEACHFIDLMLFLAGSKIINWSVSL